VTPFKVSLLIVIGSQTMLMHVIVLGASFDNLLDALDGYYCAFDGGDNSTIDGIYPDPASGGYKSACVSSLYFLFLTCGV
jgi:hypothetical protein